jgi:hypothetical protein
VPTPFRRLADLFLRLVTPPRRDAALYYDYEQDSEFDAVNDRFFGRLGLDQRRRLGYWPGEERRPDFVRVLRESGEESLEQPWHYNWNRVPKRSAGPGFDRDDYRAARERAQEVCRATLGEELWQRLHRDNFLDVPSKRTPGLSYRLRVGRRIQVICADGVESPWYYDFLCINPVYPLPEYEFFAQLYLYVRDREDEVIRVAAPQPWDQALGRTF